MDQGSSLEVIQNYLWEGQVTKVTGFADRKLRNPSNPFGVENRRISILVKKMDVKAIMEENAAAAEAEAESETESE